MKNYAYFPGCSLEKIASSYNVSAVESLKKLGVNLKELEDWNCCGATTYFYIDELLAYTLCARNLAIAEKTGLELVAPCSACYKNMYFTAAHLKKDADLAEHVNFALEEDSLHYSGKVNIKHLIEVFAQDVNNFCRMVQDAVDIHLTYSWRCHGIRGDRRCWEGCIAWGNQGEDRCLFLRWLTKVAGSQDYH